MNYLILLVGLGVLAWLLYTFVVDFISETGSPWQRLLAAGKGSATKLWARAVMLPGLIAMVLPDLADLLGDSSLANTVKEWLASVAPEYLGPFLVMVSVVTILARRRTA